MDKKKNFILVIILVGLLSQLYTDFQILNLKFSLSAVAFSVFLYIYSEINPILLGVSSGLSLGLFRMLFYIIDGGTFKTGIFEIFPEVIFYTAYGTIFYIFSKPFSKLSISQMFFTILGSDFLSNIVEVCIRIGIKAFLADLYIIKDLIVVAIIRAGMAILVITLLKYYKMFLIKEEHEERYKKLLWLTSRLNMEVYRMRENIDYTQNTMSNAYELFLKINNNEDKESWANRSLEISKEVHEIQKGYEQLLEDIEEILANRIDDNGMDFHELALILKENLEAEINSQNKDITLDFNLGKDFHTEKQYYLISVLTNIIMNSIDSIEYKGKIVFTHKVSDKDHLFIIEDNGCGIKIEEILHIFSPGYSTKMDYKTGKTNKGLGLSIAKSIVEVYLKGDISVFSEKDEGTTFEISIPIVEIE
ncbi:MAG: Histidine kinase domain-containing protein [Sporanaerobacter sp.]|jgi:two-component system, sensor histidine kinase YcbA|uniref:sensor histidine kinase n=1 Tax=Sporanaerobacter sp. TaxID=2010183 RepID=UPI003A0FE7FD